MNVRTAVKLLLAAIAVAARPVRADGSSSTIIYVVIAVVVVLFLAAALFMWHRHRKQKQAEVEFSPEFPQPSLPTHASNPSTQSPATSQVQVTGSLPPDQSNQPLSFHMSEQDGQHGTPQNAFNVPMDPARHERRKEPRSHPSYDQRNHPPREPRSTPVPPPAYPHRDRRAPDEHQRPVSDNDREDNRRGPAPPSRPSGDRRRHHAEDGRQQGEGQYQKGSPVRKMPPRNPKSDKKAPEQTEKSREAMQKVLTEFQTDPALGRRRIPYSALYFTRVLSKGAFGEVWLAQLENRQVAVKRILSEKKNDEKEIECFGAEIRLMASFYHPKIVEFVGVAWSGVQDLCAVTEYMAKGDLYNFLRRKKKQLNWRDHKIFLAEDVAEAIRYLHSLTPKVIHRDLKSKNILLDGEFRAKLSDFGISRERSIEETMTAGVGTIYWTAPEVLMGKKYDERSDVYSFGIVMSELDTGEVPYSDKRDDSGKKLQGMNVVKKVIGEKMRPAFSAECPSVVLELATRCLDSDPSVRPDAPELLQLVQEIEDQL